DGGRIAARVTSSTDGWRATLDATLDAVEQGLTRWVAQPLDLTLSAMPNDAAAAIDATLRDRSGLIAARFQGLGDAAGASGDLSFAPVDFSAPGTAAALRRLMPALPADLALDGGELGFDGTLGFSADGPIASGVFRIDDLALTYDLVGVRGVSGVVDFADLVSPRTRGSSALTIDALDAGLALRDGVVDFAVGDRNGAPALLFGGSRWSAAGGTVRSGGFAVGSAVGARRVVLDVENVDIEALLLAADIPNLDGVGRLSGRVPLVIDPGTGLRVQNARLTSADGRIAYAPPGLAESLGGADPRTPQGYLLALEDFRYDQMLAQVDGGLDDGLSFGFTLAGRNPAVADGAPIRFEINVDGLRPLQLMRGFSAAREAAEAAAERASGNRR
ncbi:MAG: YdbH domain-containing protein, partial [Pseudomonadota bacterium]